MNDFSETGQVPTFGRLLGLDYGTARVGIAVSTPEQNIASPLENYTRQNRDADGRRLVEIVREYDIVGLVVGLPVHMSGDEGQKAIEAREFGQWAGTVTQLPVCYWDERFTSLVAEMHLQQAGLTKKKRKARLDKLSAQIMLQNFLDSEDRSASPSDWSG